MFAKLFSLLSLMLIFVACSPAQVSFKPFNRSTSIIEHGCTEIGNEVNCSDGDPYVDTPGVVTALLAFGDEVNDQLVINGTSSRLLAENMVRYASPVKKPKILLVRDRNHNGETVYDTEFIRDELLKNHDVQMIEEPENGLKAENLENYNLVWFNNPGHSMGNEETYKTLLAFKGGVILSGDDLTQGSGFDISALTGLKYIDNGASVKCGENTFKHDNNSGYQYDVSLDQTLIPNTDSSLLNLKYGNDIDNSELLSNLEVLARAKGGDESCTELRPVIVRYPKQ